MKKRYPKIRRISAGASINNKRVDVCETCGAWHKKPLPFMCGSYGCTGTTYINFDSQAEAKRWAELLLLVRANKIEKLGRQKRFALNTVNPEGQVVKIGEYWSDFHYEREGRMVVEDVKGAITDLSEWKIRHMKAQYEIDVALIQY